jgi:hypothetical protein
MKIYLAARYSRHDEMQGIRDVLRTLGHDVTSRWIDCHTDVVGDFTASFTPEVLNQRPEACAPLGQHDLDDLDVADTVISFTSNGTGKGGRHVEFGYALAKGKRCIVVGPREHVFHTLAQVEWYPDWPSLTFVLAEPLTLSWTTVQNDPGCTVCGRDNRNGTHDALELAGHLRHSFTA